MSAKRTDNKGRVLRLGESQRKNMYMYRYTDRYGKRQTIYAPTLPELREKEKQIVVAESGGVQVFNNITLGELLDKLCQLTANAKRSTVENNSCYRNFVKRYPIAAKRVRDIKASEVRLWLMGLIDEEYSPHTVQKMAHVCRQACRIAVDDNIVAKNPFDINLKFLPPKPRREALTEDEQQCFLAFMQEIGTTDFFVDYYIILLETGLRVSEFRGLTRKNVDMEHREITIDHQLTGDGPARWMVTTTKTEMGNRTIPMSDDAYAAFARVLKREEEIGTGIVVDDLTGFIALGKMGSLVNDGYFCSTFMKLCDQYNEKFGTEIKVTPHILRHTFCTNMFRRGTSPLTLQYLMGHADLTTTIGIYTHNDRARSLKEARETIGA